MFHYFAKRSIHIPCLKSMIFLSKWRCWHSTAFIRRTKIRPRNDDGMTRWQWEDMIKRPWPGTFIILHRLPSIEKTLACQSCQWQLFVHYVYRSIYFSKSKYWKGKRELDYVSLLYSKTFWRGRLIISNYLPFDNLA